MLKHLLLFTTFVGFSSAVFADDLRSTAITEAGNAEKVTDAVKAEADSVHWKFPCRFAINFSHSGFNKNWQGGGTNSLNFNVSADLNANYKRDRHLWTNNLYAEYGAMFSKDLNTEPFHDDFRKTTDRLELNSKYGFQSAKVKSLYYSALFQFKTQMLPGYEYDDDGTVFTKTRASNLLAPANMVLALGLDYQPNKYVSVFLSPLTGRFVYVNDTLESVVTKEKTDSAWVTTYSNINLREKYGLKEGKRFDPSLGAYLRITNDFDIVKNIHLKSKLDFFSPYTAWSYDDKTRFITRTIVDWDMLLSAKITKYITASLHTQYLFDPNVGFAKLDENGNQVDAGTKDGLIHSRSQFMYQYNIGFAYSF